MFSNRSTDRETTTRLTETSTMHKAMLTFVKSTNSSSRNFSVKQRRTRQRLDSGEKTAQNPHPVSNPQIQIQNSRQAEQAAGRASSMSMSSMSRVRGRVGVAVARDRDARENPAASVPSKRRKTATTRNSYFPVSNNHEDESTFEDELWWMDTPPKTKSRARQQPPPSNLPPPPPQDAAMGFTSDLTGHRITGETAADDRSVGSPQVFAACDRRHTLWSLDGDGGDYGDDIVYVGSTGSGEALSLSSWLSPPQSTATRETKRARSTEAARPDHAKRARPTKVASSDNIQISRSIDGFSSTTSKTWANMGFSRHQGNGVASGAAAAAKNTSSTSNSLSDWLEPRMQPKDDKEKNRRKGRVDAGFDRKHERDVDADRRYKDGENSCGDVAGEDWISERLGGLDPDGVASWSGAIVYLSQLRKEIRQTMDIMDRKWTTLLQRSNA